jgi:hypothetical protein
MKFTWTIHTYFPIMKAVSCKVSMVLRGIQNPADSLLKSDRPSVLAHEMNRECQTVLDKFYTGELYEKLSNYFSFNFHRTS